jgi:hypothetical protein
MDPESLMEEVELLLGDRQEVVGLEEVEREDSGTEAVVRITMHVHALQVVEHGEEVDDLGIDA